MKIEWKTCFKVGVSAFILYLCISYWDVFISLLGKIAGASAPLIIGCVIAYILNIIMGGFERIYFPNSKKSFANKSRRPVCLILSFIALIALITFVVSIVLPQLISCAEVIIKLIPNAFNSFVGFLDENHILSKDIINNLYAVDWQSKIGDIFNVIGAGLGNAVTFVFGALISVFSGIVTSLISLIFAIYLVLGKNKLKAQLKRTAKCFLSEKILKKTGYVLGVANQSFRRFIIGQSVEALILGCLCTLGMLILRLPYATIIGALVSFTALIPVAGAYIGAGVGAFMIMTESPLQAIVFLVFLIILQQLEGNIIYPKVVGTSLGLPGIWVLAAVTIGGGMFGIIGMLLGVPIAATLYRLLREHVNKQDHTCKETPEPITEPNESDSGYTQEN